MENKRVQYCLTNYDGTITQVPHAEVVAHATALITDGLQQIYGHSFGNYRYIEGLLTKAADPLALASRFVQGLKYRINQGSRPPNEVYENALTWLESQCD